MIKDKVDIEIVCCFWVNICVYMNVVNISMHGNAMRNIPLKQILNVFLTLENKCALFDA